MILALLSGGICCLPAPLSAEVRCATVNVQLLVVTYHKVAKEAKVLKAERIKLEQDLTALQEKRKEVSKTVSDLGQKILQMETPPPRGSDIRNEYNTLVSEYNALGKDIGELTQVRIREVERKLFHATTKSLKEIQAAIHDYAREQGYHWVIDTSGTTNTGVPPLVYARDAPDITSELAGILNKDAPDQGANKPEKAGPAAENADQPVVKP